MRKMIRKKKNSNKFPLFVFLITLFIIFSIVVLAVANIRIYEKRASLQSYIYEKKTELDILKERINQGNIPDGAENDLIIEKIAREQLLLKRPGEEVVFIIPPESAPEVVKENKKEFKWWNPFTWTIWP